MDFHLDGLVAGQILHFVFKDAGHTHFLTGTHILIVQHQSCFFQRSVGLGIPFRLGIGRFRVDVGIFAVVDGGDLDTACVTGVHGFLHLGGHAVHFYHLGIFRRAGLVEVGYRGLFPGVPHYSQAHNLDLGFGNTRI